MALEVKLSSGRDCVKSLRSSYTGWYPQKPSLLQYSTVLEMKLCEDRVLDGEQGPQGGPYVL